MTNKPIPEKELSYEEALRICDCEALSTMGVALFPCPLFLGHDRVARRLHGRLVGTTFLVLGFLYWWLRSLCCPDLLARASRISLD